MATHDDKERVGLVSGIIVASAGILLLCAVVFGDPSFVALPHDAIYVALIVVAVGTFLLLTSPQINGASN